jgi:hypothetical protein
MAEMPHRIPSSLSNNVNMAFTGCPKKRKENGLPGAECTDLTIRNRKAVFQFFSGIVLY